MSPLAEISDQDVADLITLTVLARGYPPSLTEVGDHFGLKSKATVFKLLRRVEEAGLIRRVPGVPRAISVVTK